MFNYCARERAMILILCATENCATTKTDTSVFPVLTERNTKKHGAPESRTQCPRLQQITACNLPAKPMLTSVNKAPFSITAIPVRTSARRAPEQHLPIAAPDASPSTAEFSLDRGGRASYHIYEILSRDTVEYVAPCGQQRVGLCRWLSFRAQGDTRFRYTIFADTQNAPLQ